MTTFTLVDLSYALAIGLLIGIGIVAGMKTQHAANPEGLQALQQRMGSLYTIALFASGALPAAAMWLCASLRTAPTPIDTLLPVILIGLGLVAAYTLLGNAMRLLSERLAAKTTG